MPKRITYTPQQMEDAISFYLGPETPSENATAIQSGVPLTSLRRELKKRGIVRSSGPEAKRQKVAAHFSGLVKGLANGEAYQSAIEAAATQDITDMEMALGVARACIVRLAGMVESVDNPKDIKTIADANDAAISTIRRIRGLDDPSADLPGVNILIEGWA